MNATITRPHVGDLHIEAGDGWASLERRREVVAGANRMAGALDVVFLPGDNADNARPAEYAAVLAALEPVQRPWRTVPRDHDHARGGIEAFEHAMAPGHRPPHEIIAGYRCIFLDIVSTGAGGPDFRLSTHHRLRFGW